MENKIKKRMIFKRSLLIKIWKILKNFWMINNLIRSNKAKESPLKSALKLNSKNDFKIYKNLLILKMRNQLISIILEHTNKKPIARIWTKKNLMSIKTRMIETLKIYLNFYKRNLKLKIPKKLSMINRLNKKKKKDWNKKK